MSRTTWLARKRGASGKWGDLGSPLLRFFSGKQRLADENIVKVQIFNQTYPISTENEDPEYVKQVAEYLDRKMHEAAATVGQRAPLDIAILAALNVADEVLSERGKKDALLTEADKRIGNFARLLEDSSADEEDQQPPSRF